jgi:glutaredoxin-related protein
MPADLKLSLYYYDSCAFCRVILQELAFLNLVIEKRNILQNPQHREDMMKGGGRQTVPCLLVESVEEGGSQIQQQWLYESRRISVFLRALSEEQA